MATGLEIAVIGMSGRFPGAADLSEFWENLILAKETISVFDSDNPANGNSSVGDNFVPARGIIPKKSQFDYKFFGYSHHDAEKLHPAHRIMHECIWEAIDDAAIAPMDSALRIGLFSGVSDDFNWRLYQLTKTEPDSISSFSDDFLVSTDYVAALIAYKLNLRGPVVNINTACSTGLMAIDMACKALLFGESDVCLVGAVSLSTIAERGYHYTSDFINSKDGHCRPFDSAATGTVGSEGCGVIVLKRLSEAIQDSDHIHAVILGSASNNDGQNKVGFSAPSVSGQVECLREALSISDVDPQSVRFIETHGSGTFAGDPVEYDALQSVYCSKPRVSPIFVGSVKSNIGHAGVASGMAGFIKAVLALQHKSFPATLHFNSLNPDIRNSSSHIIVNNSNAFLEANPINGSTSTPMRGAVSSLGIGGTNCHLILEEYLIEPKATRACLFEKLCISAFSQSALANVIQSFERRISDGNIQSVVDLSFTLCRKAQHRFRTVLQFEDDVLRKFVDQQFCAPALEHLESKDPTPIVFLFSGFSTQNSQVGQELYNLVPQFKMLFDALWALVEKTTSTSNSNPFLINAAERRKYFRTDHIFLFVLELSISRFLKLLGIIPSVLLGNSMGEMVAACFSGAMLDQDVINLLFNRDKICQSLQDGFMLSIACTPEEAGKYLKGSIELAAINSLTQTVLSGHTDDYTDLREVLTADSIDFVDLRSDLAYHHSSIKSAMHGVRSELSALKFAKAEIPYYSSLTGEINISDQLPAFDYWVEQMSSTVQLKACCENLLSDPRAMILIEIGSGSTLSSLLLQTCKRPNQLTFYQTLSSILDSKSDKERFSEMLASLWLRGLNLNWTPLFSESGSIGLSLPIHCFDPYYFPAEVEKSELIAHFNESKSVHINRVRLSSESWLKSAINISTYDGNLVFLLFSPDSKFFRSFYASLPMGSRLLVIDTNADSSYISFSTPRENISFYTCVADAQKEIIHKNISIDFVVLAIVDCYPLEDVNSGLDIIYSDICTIIAGFVAVARGVQPSKFIIITSDVFTIGRRAGDFSVSSLLGPLSRIINQEYNFYCQHIDLCIDDSIVDSLAQAISIAVDPTQLFRDTIIIRGGFLYHRSHSTLKLSDVEGSIIRNRGHYFVIGGLGQMGEVLCNYLLNHYDVRLTIIGRTELFSKDSNNNRKLDVYNLLKSRSSNLTYYSVDISDFNQLSNCVGRVLQDCGKIDGVLHLGADLDPRLFRILDDLDLSSYFSASKAKVHGLINIRSVFSKLTNCDFFWFASSLASLVGGLGYFGYASGCFFLDQFVQASRDIWNGVAVDFAELDYSSDMSSPSLLGRNDIIRVFEDSLRRPSGTVIRHSNNDLAELESKLFMHAHKLTIGSNKLKSDPEVINDFPFENEQIASMVVGMLHQLFGSGKISIDDDFVHLGGDSLKGLVLIRHIKVQFGVVINIKQLFELRTPRLLAAHISRVKLAHTDTADSFYFNI